MPGGSAPTTAQHGRRRGESCHASQGSQVCTWVRRTNPEALRWSVDALNPAALSGRRPTYIGLGSAPTLDLTWLLVGATLPSDPSKTWHTSQNFVAEYPVRGVVASPASAVMACLALCPHRAEHV